MVFENGVYKSVRIPPYKCAFLIVEIIIHYINGFVPIPIIAKFFKVNLPPLPQK